MFSASLNYHSGVYPCTPAQFWAAVRLPMVGKTCASIADALEAVRRGDLSKEEFEKVKSEEKKKLPIFTFHATFKGTQRKNAEAVPSGLSMYDVDHIPDPRGYFEEKVAPRKEELGIVLAHITPSTEGLRLVFVIPKGMTLAEAQRWMSEQLGDTNYDQCVKDLARCSFAVPEDYILYINEEGLFKDYEVAEPSAEPKPEPVAAKEEPEKAEEAQAPDANGENDSFRGIPYADIINRWFTLTGGEPRQGERNTKLYQLALQLRYIADNSEALLLRVIPRYGLPEAEVKGLIHSACSAKWQTMPRTLRNVLDTFESLRTINNTSEPPAMPEKLPKLIELLISRTPEIYQPAVAHAVFPSLATHLHLVKFRYIDNVEHEATLMNVLMAGTGAGKNCISEPINRIMADIRQRDEENLRREREWKKEINSKGANKDKRQRPEGLIIQEIDADMTNPAFVMRTREAEEHFLYTKLNEIDQFDALKGNGRGGQQFQIMCLSFDPGNRYGQTRVGAQSVTEKVCIRFNWNAATTIIGGQRYFSQVLTDGPISRINFCTIPEREIGAEIPVYGTYDEEFDKALKPYIENLVKASGLVECPEAFQLAVKLNEENADFARLSQDRVYENLSFRANVIAYLKACVLYVANGCQWEDSIDEFIRWSLRYDRWCKMAFFGDAIQRQMTTYTKNVSKRRGPQSLLALLPDEFTFKDAEQIRLNQGLEAKGTKEMLYQWIHRGHLTVLSNDKYKKTEKDESNIKKD